MAVISLFVIVSVGVACDAAVTEESIVKMQKVTIRESIGCAGDAPCFWDAPTRRHQIAAPVARQRPGMSEEQYFQNHTFVVYTKADVDGLLAKIEQKFVAQEKEMQRQQLVFTETVRSVLLRIESLPAEIPGDSSFYSQVRDRLLADVRKELEQTKQ
ncbi:hypothetical protein A1D31_37430 [Bradyrhizobium liaoningense]|nr:hypothetical protein A1D31_37430 [Bradyrhizobium liaoningense]